MVEADRYVWLVRQHQEGGTIDDYSPYNSAFREYSLTGLKTITLEGKSTFIYNTAPKKAEKPAPKPKKPSVKASADHVRKVTVAHQRLTKAHSRRRGRAHRSEK